MLRGGGKEGIAALYPFLYSDSSDLEHVLEETRRSTVAKAEEIVALRRTVWEQDGERLIACALDMARRFVAGARLLTFGNGGSSTDAQAVAGMFLHPEETGARSLPALALTNDVAVITALSNDVGFDVVFARQIAAWGRPGDIALGLSTSGSSGNVIAAFEEASRRGLVTIGLAGNNGGQMALVDTIEHLFVVPSASVHRIQEAQTTIYDLLWELCQTALTAP